VFTVQVKLSYEKYMHQDENLLDLLERLCYKGFSFPFNRVYYVEQLVFWE